MSIDMAEDKLMKRIEPWEETVEKLYKEMYPVLYVYTMRILKNSDLEEEAVQDAFCIACAKRDGFLAEDDIHIPEEAKEYANIQEALEDYGFYRPVVPQWLPDGYVQEELIYE